MTLSSITSSNAQSRNLHLRMRLYQNYLQKMSQSIAGAIQNRLKSVANSGLNEVANLATNFETGSPATGGKVITCHHTYLASIKPVLVADSCVSYSSIDTCIAMKNKLMIYRIAGFYHEH